MTTDGFAFLLAPGAGAPSSHPRMQDFARLFAELGPVDLLDYPYMLAGRNHPAAETGLLGSNAILACVMWPATPAERLRLAITAPHVLPSTAVTVSASAISLMTWLNPTPHRLTVYASAAPLPVAPATLVTGRLARPYPSGTFPRRIALTLPSARPLQSESITPWRMTTTQRPSIFSMLRTRPTPGILSPGPTSISPRHVCIVATPLCTPRSL